MSPCFFKNLGPINISIIKNYLNCQTNNISHKEQFDELVGLDSIKRWVRPITYQDWPFKLLPNDLK